MCAIFQGILELKQAHGIEHSTENRIQYFLDRFYMSRISIRMLINQHSESEPPAGKEFCISLFSFSFSFKKNHNFIYRLCGNWGCLIGLRLHQLQEQSYPFLSVCVACLCAQTVVGFLCLGLSVCAQMLMHATAHGGCANTVRIFAVSWLWEKNPLLHWGIKPASVLCPAFWSNALPAEPWREAGDVWCHSPVWNFRAVIWFPFLIALFSFFLPRLLALSVLQFFLLIVHFPDFFSPENSNIFVNG